MLIYQSEELSIISYKIEFRIKKKNQCPIISKENKTASNRKKCLGIVYNEILKLMLLLLFLDLQSLL